MKAHTSQSFLTIFENSDISVTFQGEEIEFSQGMMAVPLFEMTLIWNAMNELQGMNYTSQNRSNAQQYRRENL